MISTIDESLFERSSLPVKFWPVPDSYRKSLPQSGEAGCFWENRGDRRHCGIDIYAPPKSPVLAVDTGRVLRVGIFSSPEAVPYWNVTYFILIRHEDGLVANYAELEQALVKEGDAVRGGDAIGLVGAVLNAEKITESSPSYVQRLKGDGHSSMLHFELYQGLPLFPSNYLGGNAFSPSRPSNILDPTAYLEGVAG